LGVNTGKPMFICETLYVEKPSSDLRELLIQFFRGFGIKADLAGYPSKHKKLEFAPGPGFNADAIRIMGPDSYVEYLSQTLGFTPNAKLMLFYDRYTDLETTRCQLLQATLYLAHHTKWNISLRLQNKIVLVRANGALCLGKHPEIWTPQYLKMVKPPYAVVDFNGQPDVVFS